jgi:hypothetical protein
MFHCAGSDETDTVTGAKSSTCTQDTGSASNLGLANGILVFSIESGGGGGAVIPVFMNSYRQRII